MAEEQDDSQKTEEPTQRRLDDARKKGQVATSREVNTWFSFLAVAVLVAAMAEPMMASVGSTLASFLSEPHQVSANAVDLQQGMTAVVVDIARAMAPAIALLAVVAVLGGVVQHGWLFAPGAIAPQLDRVSPASGFSRLFSVRSFLEFGKGILKLAVVGGIALVLLRPVLDNADRYEGLSVAGQLGVLHDLALRMLFGVVAAMAVIAAIDFLLQKQQFLRQMRMTKQEVREDYKQSEGDPIIKARLRQIRMERTRRRMMAAVPEATVVITNPTHFAVALKYDVDSMAAPKLVAKGADHIAKRIRELAEENDVPIVENPPLARALNAGVDIDEEVPPEHYRAVAEVIGFVMRLKGKKA